MAQDATSHPSWCDPSVCTVDDSWPYGAHQSTSHVVAAHQPVTTVAELHLTSTMPGLSPYTLVMPSTSSWPQRPAPRANKPPDRKRRSYDDTGGVGGGG
jgi:hypothetical protein